MNTTYVPPDLADIIRENGRMAFDFAILKVFREQINGGDPWPLIGEVYRINPEVGKSSLFDAIGIKPKLTNDDADLPQPNMSEDIKKMQFPAIK